MYRATEWTRSRVESDVGSRSLGQVCCVHRNFINTSRRYCAVCDLRPGWLQGVPWGAACGDRSRTKIRVSPNTSILAVVRPARKRFLHTSDRRARSAKGAGFELGLLIAALRTGLPSVCHLDRSSLHSVIPSGATRSRGIWPRRSQPPALDLSPSNRCVPDTVAKRGR